LSDEVQMLGAASVEVGDAVFQQHHADGFAVLVEDADPTVVAAVPQDLVGVGQLGDVLLDLVGAPADASGIDRVGD
jgi:hypothetical protein